MLGENPQAWCFPWKSSMLGGLEILKHGVFSMFSECSGILWALGPTPEHDPPAFQSGLASSPVAGPSETMSTLCGPKPCEWTLTLASLRPDRMALGLNPRSLHCRSSSFDSRFVP